MKTVLLIFITIATIEAKSIREKCMVSIDHRSGHLKEPQPLILTDSDEPNFFMPNDRKILTIPSNEAITLACLGKNNHLQNGINKSHLARAACVQGTRFSVGSEIHEFTSFRCKTPSENVIRKSPQGSPGLQHCPFQYYEIGFDLGIDNHFLRLIELCRDDKTHITHYAWSRIPKEIGEFQNSYPRSRWRTGELFGPHDLNNAFRIGSQIRSIGALLGSDKLARKYVRNNKEFLNRGHLVAKTDFVYGSQQNATFWLINTQPQWSRFNGGNWNNLEMTLRKYASEHQLDLDVYTGVHRITSLKDVEGRERPLYLHFENENDRAFPVPRFFWKIAHDRANDRAVAFVGLNEPYATSVTADMLICPDVGDQTGWHSRIGWAPKDFEKGLSYVCLVDELRKAVPIVPSLGKIDLMSAI